MSASLKVAPSPTLADVRSQFAAWRATRPAGRRIPEPLWQLATGLLSSHSAAQSAQVSTSDINTSPTAAPVGFVKKRLFLR
jgi:hypothetical protein